MWRRGRMRNCCAPVMLSASPRPQPLSIWRYTVRIPLRLQCSGPWFPFVLDRLDYLVSRILRLPVPPLLLSHTHFQAGTYTAVLDWNQFQSKSRPYSSSQVGRALGAVVVIVPLRELFDPLRELFHPSMNYLPPSVNYLTPP